MPSPQRETRQPLSPFIPTPVAVTKPIGDLKPTLGEQFLDVAVAQGEAKIQPDRVLDDLGREAMAAVAEQGHADTLPDPPTTPDSVSVTMP
jgi:hypothetical protein